jgi:hypothetical protein
MQEIAPRPYSGQNGVDDVGRLPELDQVAAQREVGRRRKN